MKTRKEAEARALELYPDNSIKTNWLIQENKRKAYIQCWDEMQQEYQNQSLAIAKEPVSSMLVNVMRYCDQNQRVQLIRALQERTEIKDKQTCGFCVEPKQQKKECKDEEHGIYESKHISEQSEKKVNESVDNDKLRNAAENVSECWSEANATGNKVDIVKLEKSIEQLQKALK